MKDNRFFSRRIIANLIVVTAGILLYLALANITAVGGAIVKLLSALSPFIVGIAIAYLLNIPVCFFERKVFKRFRKKRMFSILITYVLAILILGLLLGMVLPQLITSIYTLIGNMQGYFSNINRLIGWAGETMQLEQEAMDAVMVSYKDIVNQIVTFIRGILSNVLGMTMRVGTGIVSALTAIIASVYMLFAKEKLLLQFRRLLYAVLPKRHANNLMRVGHLSNGMFSGFIGGKIIDSAIIGLICFVFMSLMNFGPIKMPYALLISVVIGVTNIIPFYGPFIGAIPSVLILLMMDPWSALWFGVFIIVLQQFDGNYLGPKILGNSIGLPAIWVLIAIVVGGGLFGFIGMLLGVPTVAVFYVLASDSIEKRLKKKGLTDTDIIDGQAADTDAASADDHVSGDDEAPDDMEDDAEA